MNFEKKLLVLAVGTCLAIAHGDRLGAQDPPITECPDQTYALCATATCFVYNLVAYCKCDVLEGTSISLTLTYDNGTKDVCDVNAQGATNGFMTSTFSIPASTVQPGATEAMYTCPAGSTGAYAQCDGGLCFDSTRGQSFPGFEGQLQQDEIICACPITMAPDRGHSYQIAGPYNNGCDSNVYSQCTQTYQHGLVPGGTMIPVGAPPGGARVLGGILSGGSAPDFASCRQAG